MKEIRPLTSLRALAALLVFMYHYAWLFPPSARGITDAVEWIPLMSVWRQGQVGVSIFFVLSGFLITRIYFDKMASGRAPLRLYFVKRVARIWPLFVAFAVVQHAAAFRAGAALDCTSLVTLSMAQGYFEDLRYAGLPTAWSLTIEESFYAFAPFFFAVVLHFSRERNHEADPLDVRRGSRLLLVIGGVTVVMLSSGLLLVALVRSLGWNWQGFLGSRHMLLHATIFGRFPEFAIGALTAFAHRGLPLTRALRGHRADFLASSLFLAMGACLAAKTVLAGRAEPAAIGGSVVLTYLLAVLAGALILALTAGHGLIHRVLSHGVPVFLGKTSYGFYLVQLTVMMTPLLAVSDRLGAARLPVLLLLTNAFCAVMYLGWEVPARRFIVERWGGHR